MKKVMFLSAALLTASALVFTGCKKDDEEEPVITPPTPEATVPRASEQVLYLPLNGNASTSVGSATVVTSSNTWTVDRDGNANGAAYFAGATAPGNGQILELDGTFIYPSTTISVWYQIDTVAYGNGSRFVFGLGGQKGIFFEIAGDQAWMKMPTSHAIDPAGTPDHNFDVAWSDYMNGGSPVQGPLLYNYNNPNGTGLKPFLRNNNWHNIVMTFDEVSSYKTIYIDGVKVMQTDIDLNETEWIRKAFAIATTDDAGNPTPGLDTSFCLGYAGGSANAVEGWNTYATNSNTFVGAMDDLRIWNVALSESEVAALYAFEN